MRLKMWGVRGSATAAVAENLEYGSNTTCIEVLTTDGETIIFDAGSGIINLAKSLKQDNKRKKTIYLLLTHAHWDHIQGLPHFELLYDNNWAINIYAPKNIGGVGLKQVISNIFNTSHFPVPFERFSKNIKLHEFMPNSSFKLGNVSVETIEMNHPGGSCGYKITDNGRKLFFTGDHEHKNDLQNIENFITDVDFLIADGAYCAKDYPNHVGWGHTPAETWIELAEKKGVKNLIITHFAFDYSDEKVNKVWEEILDRYPNTKSKINFAKESMEFLLSGDVYCDRIGSASNWLTEFSRKLSRYYNVSTILDTILQEARNICNADAGTIYLVEDDKLSFEYSQNDTLFKSSEDNKHLYINAKIPISNASIAGFVANNAKILNIEDVYVADESAPYSFNKSFDISSNYRTKSMLTVPFIGNNSRVIGVMQLINSKKGDEIIPFTPEMVDKIKLLCIIASNAVQKGQMSIEQVMRMLQISSLKDPKETGTHVQRVGAVAAELYIRWANKNKISAESKKTFQDNLRVAAMLHDIGKVGIPDSIIKKPGKLDDEERAFMERHCAMGAELFEGSATAIDIMSKEIALNHHQKWNGTGYTGSQEYPQESGEAIPLAARITAIADVYDALVSRRSYKDAWDESEAINILKKDSGVHFDPELVECFVEILPTVKAIYQKFNDKEKEAAQSN